MPRVTLTSANLPAHKAATVPNIPLLQTANVPGNAIVRGVPVMVRRSLWAALTAALHNGTTLQQAYAAYLATFATWAIQHAPLCNGACYTAAYWRKAGITVANGKVTGLNAKTAAAAATTACSGGTANLLANLGQMAIAQASAGQAPTIACTVPNGTTPLRIHATTCKCGNPQVQGHHGAVLKQNA